MTAEPVEIEPAAAASRPSVRLMLALVVASGALFFGAWKALHHGFLARHQLLDTPIYQQYGDEMVKGRVPYRDFAVEYPPGSLAVFVLPGLGGGGHQDANVYRHRFEWLMLVCGLATVLGLGAALALRGAGRGQAMLALGFAGLAPLALGSVLLSRFDLLPAALSVAALAALLGDRDRLGLGLLGAGVAVKIYPLLLVPPAILWVWRRRGRVEALAAAQIFAVVVLLVFLPFAFVAPGGVLHSIWVQVTRPLQIESLGSSLLIAAHDLFGLGLSVQTSSGSQNVRGTGSSFVATLVSLVQIGALLGIWAWFARGEASSERLVRSCAASIVAFVALGKVLSPQFLIWLVPLVPLVRGRRGVAATGLLTLSLVLTQVWFPHRYWRLVAFGSGESALLLTRNLVLIGLLLALLWPARVPRAPRRTPLPTRTRTRAVV
ncbi:MAG: glycosyltransferase 87 family protein [Gaiellaceae bacterium]